VYLLQKITVYMNPQMGVIIIKAKEDRSQTGSAGAGLKM
jgi:hypothetical protein